MTTPLQRRPDRLAIDIVIPVYNAGDQARRCIESVLCAALTVRHEVVVVDDASSDTSLRGYLDQLAAAARITLLRNELNLGFVKSVNRGMRLHEDRDVVLLNSDTEVANDWLDRLAACAYAQEGIGTVTPFSNNATICSFPRFCADNPLPSTWTTEAIDRVFARVNAGRYLEIPTAVGFCMYIRRDCIAAVGYFDDERFPRGYGEENDFSRRAFKSGMRNVLCGDVFVFHEGGSSFGGETKTLMQQGEAALLEQHPEYPVEVRKFILDDPASGLRRAVEIELARERTQPPPVDGSLAHTPVEVLSCRLSPSPDFIASLRGKSVQLHVLHTLGGGIERWCRDYCAADAERVNLVLKPFTHGLAAGEGLMLFAGIDDRQPIAYWSFRSPINVIAIHHEEYAHVLRHIVEVFGVGNILVSSLIGHSLDCLVSGKETAVIAHDYFPACPAINLYFGGVCSRCDSERLGECHRDNPDFNPFVQLSLEERIAVRAAYLDIVKRNQCAVVVPSRSVQDNLVRLFPELGQASWAMIPHGVSDELPFIDASSWVAEGKLRVLLLGMLSPAKGQHLLDESIDRMRDIADLYLLGAKEVGVLYTGRPSVHVVNNYKLAELPEMIRQIRPHVAIHLSILPETFSFTLTEVMRMGIPPIATSLGSFQERIVHGQNGWLIAPTADALIKCLRDVDSNRTGLAEISANLRTMRRRSAREMVEDYHRLLPGSPRVGASVPAIASSPLEALCMRQAVDMSDMWGRIKSLSLLLALRNEMSPVTEGVAPVADRQWRVTERQLAVAEHHRAVAEQQRAVAEHHRAVAEHNRAVAEQQRALAEVQFNHERTRLQEGIQALNKALHEQRASVSEAGRHMEAMSGRVRQLDHQVASMQSSTSWKISSPVRVVGTGLLRARFLWDCVEPIKRDPETISRKLLELPGKWRVGGLPEVRRSLLAMRADEAQQNAWRSYLDRWNREVRPHVLAALEHMKARPLISVVVPTFNTRGAMLRQMLDSVLTQIYPDWELCIADDCSTERHVRRILEQYARDDARIRLRFSTENRGVSAATNRAIAMATGQLVVLLDHDDILEAQALFRVAQSIIEDDPDMVYSDEVLMSPSMKSVLRYAHRPAFSPELLRSHPYIVHMVGFRRTLLAEIGGFDESLRISQDYDLILRASEAAKTVVHIPEILYRWRIHGGSAGTSKMQEVMETSKRVLTEHMKRRRLSGHVDDGPRFNLFDSRYDLSSDPAVAVIIPTKNHGDLVRQCIDSIRATVSDVRVDIIVVDHDSDDPATCAYFKSIAPTVKVLRYSGPFNFSAINNWAVKQIAGPYSHYLFCNNDIEARESGWLGRMMELCQQGDVGVVGAQLLYPDGQTIQHAGVCVGAFGAAEHFAKFIKTRDIHNYLGFSEIVVSNHEVSAVTAACLLIRREAYEAVGGFDEALAVGFGDVDLCLRVGQLGFRVVQCPHAVLIHHESFTRGKTKGMDPHPEDSRLFQARWQWFLAAGDPYFNPALYQNSVAWQVRKPMICDYDIRRRIYRRDETSNRQVFSASARQGE